MGYNAIEIDGEVKLDLSEDTVTEQTLPEGVTAHDATGEPIQGKMKFVKSINGKTGDVTLNASDVGADDAGAVSTHNTNTDAHNDIRLELQRLSGIINDVLDSDDIDLNELHEIVAYIKSNSALIAAITVSKVNVADIINNLTTNVTDKPLSAAQGVELNKNKLDASKLTEAINTALAEAKASGEFDGNDGKSAYEYAKNGGYTGTETEFAKKLADEWQLKKDSNLKTESKEVVGAINEVNEKTVDKISAINTYYYVGAENIAQKPYLGITWEDTIVVLDQDEGFINEVLTYNRVPILFDENTMETEVDNQGILQVKAKGVGGDKLDKVEWLDTWYGGVESLDIDGGICWQDTFAFLDENDSVLKTGGIYHKIPIEAGENVTFEVDEENQVVKINSTGVSKEYVDNLFANIANGDEVAY